MRHPYGHFLAKLEALLLTTGRATGRAAILIGPTSICMLIKIDYSTRNISLALDERFELII